MRKPRLYGVYAVHRGTTYSQVLTRGRYSECCRWRDEQPKPGRGTRLVVRPIYLMDR